MISLDFGILFTLQSRVAEHPGTTAGFKITPDRKTQDLLDRFQSVFRLIENKAYVFASDMMGQLEEEIIGGLQLARLKEINRLVEATFLIEVWDKGLYKLLDSGYRPQDLTELKDLPESFKRVFYLKADQLPGINPIDYSFIVGLAPPVLMLEKSKVQSITFEKNNQVLNPSAEDDLSVQYDFRRALPGLYLISLNAPALPPQTRRFYADPEIYTKPPFAVLEVKVAQGQFNLKEYTIEFKSK